MTKQIDIPPFQEPYKLTDEQQRLVDRYIEEMESRLKTIVTIEVYKENHMVYPKLDDRIFFKLTAGNWKRIGTLSIMEIETSLGNVLFYFLRRLVDDTMADLLMRGANTY
jgi:hypothetical protein